MDVGLEFNDTKELKFQNFVPHIEDTLKKQEKDTCFDSQNSQVSHASALEKSFHNYNHQFAR